MACCRLEVAWLKRENQVQNKTGEVPIEHGSVSATT